MDSVEFPSIEQPTEALNLQEQITLPLIVGQLPLPSAVISQQITHKMYLEQQDTLPLAIKQHVTEQPTALGYPIQFFCYPIRFSYTKHSNSSSNTSYTCEWG